MKGLERQNRDSDNFPESDAFRENFFSFAGQNGRMVQRKERLGYH